VPGIPSWSLRRWFATGAAVLLVALPAFGDAVSIIPVADATLVGTAPSNSMGGAEWILAGTIQNGPTNRALLRFDVASAVPAGSKITSAKLVIAAIKQTTAEIPAGVTYGLHRMLTSWGEGTVPAVSPGQGAPAEAGDATWTTRFFPTNAWSVGGGGQGTDFVEAASSTAYISTLGIFEFEVTYELIADVQLWLENPGTNFGWMLKSESEEVRFSARQFASRESADPDIAPRLDIEYTLPPVIFDTRLTNGAIEFSFPAEYANSYSVQARTALGGTNTWATVTNFGLTLTPGTLTARIPTNGFPQRFFRVRMD
jgi:hypothetical protein